LYFEFEEGIFTATHQTHDLGARCLRRGGRVEVLLEGAFADRLVPLTAAKSFASHLCNEGAGEPARVRSLPCFASLESKELRGNLTLGGSQCSIGGRWERGHLVRLSA